MELGLIVPLRDGSLYNFTEDCVEDIRLINKLKEMGFSLKEIERVLSLSRRTNWVEPQEMAEYLMILDDKKEALKKRIEEIHIELKKIEKEQEEVSLSHTGDKALIGVPLRALEYLRCPHCSQAFSVEDVQMNSRYVYRGSLCCACGYKLVIQDGIVLTPDRCEAETQEASGADLTREKYKDLPASVVTMMQRTYNFMLHRIRALSLEDKVVLETRIDHFFYLYTHFRKIENRTLFIITDRHESVLRMYKERIEYMKLDLDILYVTEGSAGLPLKSGSVDLRIDYFSANACYEQSGQYFFRQNERSMKKGSEVIGCYFSGTEKARSFSDRDFRAFMCGSRYRLLKEREIECPVEAGEKNRLFLYEYLKEI